MKKLSSTQWQIWFGGLASLLMSGGVSAQNQVGWYMGLEGGANFQQNLTAVYTVPTVVAFGPGPCFRLRGGYSFSRFFALELEGGFTQNELTQLNGSDISGKGAEIRQFPILGNVLFGVPLGSRWSLSLGGGVGGVFSQWNLAPGGFYNTFQITSPDTDFVFGYQALAGLHCGINERWTFGLEYRFLATESHEWNFGSLTVPADRTMAHSVLATVTFHF